jgi:hypothetical protein
VSLTLDTFALSKMENTELQAARDRLRAAIEQLRRDLKAVEMEIDRRWCLSQALRPPASGLCAST